MTRKLDFQRKWDYLAQTVFNEKYIPDVLLMAHLGFSPQSWRTWKSKFIERSKYGSQTKTQYSTNKEVTFKIVYDKKSKIWSWEEYTSSAE